jgi:hypothetical protein
MAQWLGLQDVVVSPRGDLAAALADALSELRTVYPLSGNSATAPCVSPVD